MSGIGGPPGGKMPTGTPSATIDLPDFTTVTREPITDRHELAGVPFDLPLATGTATATGTAFTSTARTTR